MSKGAIKKERTNLPGDFIVYGKSFAACETLAHNGISVLNCWQFLLSCDFYQHNFVL